MQYFELVHLTMPQVQHTKSLGQLDGYTFRTDLLTVINKSVLKQESRWIYPEFQMFVSTKVDTFRNLSKKEKEKRTPYENGFGRDYLSFPKLHLHE